jgi:hypothetical protein
VFSLAPIVWADDDSKVALILHSWEQRRSFSETQYRNYQYQLFLEDTNGTGRTPLVAATPMSGFPALQLLYLMKGNGYVAVMTQRLDTARFEQVLLASGTRRLITADVVYDRSCNGYHSSLLPSPSGAHLAVFEEWAPCAPTTVPNAQLVVRMLDAGTLAHVRTDTLKGPPPSTVKRWRVRWTPAGDLVAVYADSAWSLLPTRAPMTTPMPTCFGAATTSSWVSSTGVRLIASGLTVAKDASIPLEPLQPFGCPDPAP